MNVLLEIVLLLAVSIPAIFLFGCLVGLVYFLPIYAWEFYATLREGVLHRTCLKWRRHRNLLGDEFSSDKRGFFRSAFKTANSFEERKCRLNQIIARYHYRSKKLGLAYPTWILAFPPTDRRNLLANAYNRKNFFFRSIYVPDEAFIKIIGDENLKKFDGYLGGVLKNRNYGQKTSQ